MRFRLPQELFEMPGELPVWCPMERREAPKRFALYLQCRTWKVLKRATVTECASSNLMLQLVRVRDRTPGIQTRMIQAHKKARRVFPLLF